MKRNYTKEFKEMAVELSYTSEKPITQLCKELGIGENLIYRWRKDMGSKIKTPEMDEIKKLKKELAEKEVEIQILKKAMAICNRM